MSEGSNSGGGCGCFSIVFVVVGLWALIFGVTVNGKHYGISGCDSTHGVQVDK